MKRIVAPAFAALSVVGLAGCGAAYYGTALAVVATQKDKNTVDTSFPDAVPTADAVPAFATLVLSTEQVTIDRAVRATGAAVSTASTVTLTDFEVLGVSFPAGYGESLSNRDAGTSLLANDRLVVRLNGDTSRVIQFDAADVASIGTVVAARIQARVRALDPLVAEVPAAAYKLFTGSYDPSTGAYTFRSGAPGEESEVVFEPEPRSGGSDAAPDEVSARTAERLGLGFARGGIERRGAQSVGITVLNRGTDVIPAGTSVDLYLSHDKVLDRERGDDLLVGRITTDQPVEVGQARRFYRTNATLPPARLLRQDFTPGLYYLIFDVAGSGGEKILDNNTVVSRRPIEVYQPVDDPATSAVEKAAPLDLAIERTMSPIGVVTGNAFSSSVTVTNVGDRVTTAVTLDIDLVLSVDATFDEPGGFVDPAGLVAGVRINPTDPNRPITVRVASTGNGPISTTVFGDSITVTYQAGGTGAGVATVQSLTTALNAVQGGLVDAFADGKGDPATQSLDALLGAAGTSETVARDLFVTTRQVQFNPVDRPLQSQSFAVRETIRTTALQKILLPIKLFPLFRLRPQLGATPDPQNTRNDIRQASNFVRVYERQQARFDSTTGVFLPTVRADDFAAFEAVTQRPVNTGSIRQGQQRTFSFTIPSTGQSFEESQLLVVLQTDKFDAHIDLLNSAGELLASNDDSALGSSPLLYTPVFSTSTSRTFYLVVSSARFDEGDVAGEGETFDLTINVNPRQTTDPALINAVGVGNVLEGVKERYEPDAPRLENDVLVPFSLRTAGAEVLMIVPQRARVKLRSRPVFTTGVETVITQFIQDAVPSPVEHQGELDPTFTKIIYRPSGGSSETSHIFERGVYAFTVRTTSRQPDPTDFRLEIDTQFIPPVTTTLPGQQ